MQIAKKHIFKKCDLLFVGRVHLGVYCLCCNKEFSLSFKDYYVVATISSLVFLFSTVTLYVGAMSLCGESSWLLLISGVVAAIIAIEVQYHMVRKRLSEGTK